MNVNDWMRQFAQTAIKNNDQSRLRIIYFAQQGDLVRQSHPEMAFEIFQLGRTTAEQLNEYCWILFFAQRLAHICIFELENLDRAIDLATRDYMLSMQDAYISCPINSAIRINLVETYLYYDPVGYADTIQEVIDYLRTTEANDSYLSLQLDDFLAQLYLKLNQLDKALDYGLRTLDEGYGYLTLTRIYWEQGEYDKALDLSEARQAVSKESPYSLADAKAWTAAMLMKAHGDPIRAKALHQQAVFVVNRINFVPNSTLYDALADYHEACGDLPSALQIRDEQLAKQKPFVGPEEIVIVRLRRARLLGRMNRLDDMTTQLAEIPSHLDKFKQPDHYEKLLNLIEAGNYSDVVWQSLE